MFQCHAFLGTASSLGVGTVPEIAQSVIITRIADGHQCEGENLQALWSPRPWSSLIHLTDSKVVRELLQRVATKHDISSVIYKATWPMKSPFATLADIAKRSKKLISTEFALIMVGIS